MRDVDGDRSVGVEYFPFRSAHSVIFIPQGARVVGKVVWRICFISIWFSKKNKLEYTQFLDIGLKLL